MREVQVSDRRYYIFQAVEANGKIQTSQPVFIGDIQIDAGIPDGGNIPVPSFLGVENNSVDLESFISIQGDILYTSEVLALAVTVDLFDPKIAKGDGDLIIDARSKTISANVDLDIFSGLITSSDSFLINSNFDVVIDGNVSINIPKKIGDFTIPFVGGKSLTADYAFQFINDGNNSNDFVAFWGHIPIFGTAGIEVSFDGDIRAIGHPPALETGSWTIFEGTESLFLEATWENAVNDVEIVIETPDGDFLSEEEFAANGIEIVDPLTYAEGKVVKVNNPKAGVWDIKVEETFLPQIGEVFYHAMLGETEKPTLIIESPMMLEESSTVNIPYQLEDVDSDATVSFFLDRDNQGFDGLLIGHSLPEDGNSFSWDTKGIAPGNYFIYGRAVDEYNEPVLVYASEHITITESIDVSLEQILSSQKAVINQPFRYQLELTNRSDRSATDLTIINTLGENATFISASEPVVKQNGQELTFKIDSLGANETQIIDMEIMPTASGNFTSRVGVTHPAYDENINNNHDFFSVDVVNPETQLQRLNNDIFSILSNSNASELNFQLVGANSEYVNEVGFFIVENEQGTITDSQGKQLNPSDEEYLPEALSQSQVIFSALNNLPNGFQQTQLTRTLGNLQGGDRRSPTFGDRIVFFFVENATTQDVIKGNADSSQVFLGLTFNDQNFNPLEVTILTDDRFNLAWQTEENNPIYDEMTFSVSSGNNNTSNISVIKEKESSEIIDLRQLEGSVSVDVSVYREAVFDNLVGFYTIDDLLGSVEGVSPESANYKQKALENRVQSLDLIQVANQQTNTISGFLEGGKLFAPFIISNGGFEDALNGLAEVYFPFLRANSDNLDHIRLLADNAFGFEDLPNGGDRDFNDLIINLEF